MDVASVENARRGAGGLRLRHQQLRLEELRPGPGEQSVRTNAAVCRLDLRDASEERARLGWGSGLP